MSLEENKALVRRYFEDAPFNPDACDEIFAPSFQFRAIVHTGVTPQTVESNPQSERPPTNGTKRPGAVGTSRLKR